MGVMNFTSSEPSFSWGYWTILILNCPHDWLSNAVTTIKHKNNYKINNHGYWTLLILNCPQDWLFNAVTTIKDKKNYKINNHDYWILLILVTCP